MKTSKHTTFLGLLCAGVALASTAFGTTYEVGTGQAYLSIGGVPWESLAAGDTVRIHWRAEPYQEKWVVCRQGTALAPITVQGVADETTGALPVISGSGATTRPALNYWGHDRGVIKIGGANTPSDTTPKFIVIENLDIQSARPPYAYTYSGTAGLSYSAAAAAIYVEKGEDITIRNCVLHDCGNGFFVASSDDLASMNILVEGCYIYGNGIVGDGFEHNSYTAAIGTTFRYNRFGPLRAGCNGNNIKDRSAGLTVSYNWIEGGSRQLDMVDGEDSVLITGAPSYGQDFVYGNILVEPLGDGNNQMMQYGGDNGAIPDRNGTLLCYNNTFVTNRTDNTVLAKLSTNDETCDFRNNIVFASAAIGKRVALLEASGTMRISHNWLMSGWRTSFETFTGTLVNDGTTITGTTPKFVDAPTQDYGLQSTSPCVNTAGSLHPSAIPPEYEYVKHQTGQERPVAGLLDIGAFEMPSLTSGTSGALISGIAGTPVAGEPAGTFYSVFGVPSINDAGSLAFTAKIALGASLTNSVLTGTNPSVLVRQGDAADGASGTTFKSFKPPMLNQAGAVALLAQLSGSGVSTSNDYGVWSDAFGGGVRFVAREGDAATSGSGAQILSFTSAALDSGTTAPMVAYVAKLTGSGVSTSNNSGLWSYDGTTTRLLLRKGTAVLVGGTSRLVTNFSVLGKQGRAPGQGFGLCNGMMTALLTLDGNKPAVATIFADGSDPELAALNGDVAPEYNAGVVFSSFRGVAQNSSGGAVFTTSVKAAIKKAVTSASNTAIYEVTGGAGGALDRIAVKGAAAAVVSGSATFTTFNTAVNNAEDHAAFMAKIAGSGISPLNDSGIWLWTGTDIVRVAQEGDAAPGGDGATWMTLASLALPDGGRPLFTGLLNPSTGIPAATKSTDSGLWALDSEGNLQLLVREGVTTVDDRTVKSFKVLGAISGSPSQTRSHNGVGKIVYWATFTDGTQGIVKVVAP
jgi:hypothetical protein